jgi:hypothetical protein
VIVPLPLGHATKLPEADQACAIAHFSVGSNGERRTVVPSDCASSARCTVGTVMALLGNLVASSWFFADRRYGQSTSLWVRRSSDELKE